MLGSAPLHSMVTSGMAPIVVSTNFAVSWMSCDFTWTVCVAPIFLAISRRLSQISEQWKIHESCTVWCHYNTSNISKLLQRSCLPTPLIENDLEIFLRDFHVKSYFMLFSSNFWQNFQIPQKRDLKSQQLSPNSVLTIDTPYLTLCARYGVFIFTHCHWLPLLHNNLQSNIQIWLYWHLTRCTFFRKLYVFFSMILWRSSNMG